MNIDFKKCGGLAPAIIQDADTRQVLMLGFMNQEALDKTISTGLVTFFSRTRQTPFSSEQGRQARCAILVQTLAGEKPTSPTHSPSSLIYRTSSKSATRRCPKGVIRQAFSATASTAWHKRLARKHWNW